MSYEALRRELKNKMLEEMRDRQAQMKTVMFMMGIEIVTSPDGRELTIHHNGPGKMVRQKSLRSELEEILQFSVTINVDKGVRPELADEILCLMSGGVGEVLLTNLKEMLAASRDFAKPGSEEEAMKYVREMMEKGRPTRDQQSPE
jgi:hypothetical protein